MAEYIVDGAILRCDKGIHESKLKVSSSRLCITGKPAASHLDCIPIKNIEDFGLCISGTYERSAKAVKGEEHPCVLDLMEKYYLPDEAHFISDAMEIIAPLIRCQKAIREIISTSVDGMRELQHALLKEMNEPLTDEIVSQYGILWKSTGHVNRLSDGAKEVQQAAAAFYAAAVQNCSYLIEGNGDANIAERAALLLEKLKELPAQADMLNGLPKIRTMHPITTESFTVCRCGGMLTFITSGQ